MIKVCVFLWGTLKSKQKNLLGELWNTASSTLLLSRKYNFFTDSCDFNKFSISIFCFFFVSKEQLWRFNAKNQEKAHIYNLYNEVAQRDKYIQKWACDTT